MVVPHKVVEIARRAGHAGINAYLVGGVVRDLLAGREIVDVDVAAEDPEGLGRALGDIPGGKLVLIDERNVVWRVILPPSGPVGKSMHIDLSRLKGSIDDDLAQRDFTVDAMAMPLGEIRNGALPTGAIADPFDGKGDLARHTLRALNDMVFQADALRLLRAVRIARELGLVIEPRTEALVRRDGKLIASVSGERVREEMLRILSAPGATGALDYMERLSLLTAVVPEMEATKRVKQPKEHYWDVFQHCVETVGAVEAVLGISRWRHGEQSLMDLVPVFSWRSSYFSEEVAPGATRLTLLKLAALLHDIAKPQTRAVDESGRTRFLGHATVGAGDAEAILERWRCSNRETRLVATVIKYHLRPGQMSQEGLPTRRALYRFFRDAEGGALDILYLYMADFLASRGPEIEVGALREPTEIVKAALSYYQNRERERPAPLVDGNDLMIAFGLKPGRELGRILELIREAQGAGEISTRNEALEHARVILS